MAWSFAGGRGSNNNKTSGAVLSVSPSANIGAGAVLLAVCISDNLQNASATKDHAVTDFDGNTWVKIAEISNAAPAGGGITLSLWLCHVTTAISSTRPIGMALSGATTAKALALYELGVGAGMTVAVAGVATSEQDGTAAPTVTLNSLPSSEYLWIGICARENDDVGTYAMDADYTDRGKFGTTGGTAATNVSAIVGSRVATLTTDTFAPTIQTASDCCSILVALKEVKLATVECTGLTVDGTKRHIYFGKHSREVEWSAVADTLAAVLGPEVLQAALVSRFKALDPTGTDSTKIVGKKLRAAILAPQFLVGAGNG